MRSSIEESKSPHPNSQITRKEETQANREDPNTKPKGLPVFNGRKEIDDCSSDNSRKGSSILSKVQTKEIHKACNHTEYFQPIQLGRCKQIEGNHDTETTNNSIIIRIKEGHFCTILMPHLHIG